MAYGTLKVDTITFTNGGVDQSITVSGIVASTSGDLTVTGTISGSVIRGGTLISGATITGGEGQFNTLTGNTAGFTTLTGTTITGTTANFVTVSGTTVTGTTGDFDGTVTAATIRGTTTVSGATITGTTAQFTTLTGGTAGFTTVTGNTITGATGNFDGTVTAATIRGTTTVSGVTITGTTGDFGGTVTAATIRGTTTVSGATITGTTAQFTTLTGGTAGFTTITGATVTGTTGNFSVVSGTTITGNIGRFTTLTGIVATITSGVFASGLATNPSISFTGDSDTGFYSTGANQFAIATSGLQRLNFGVAETVLNESGLNHDFRVEGDNDASLFLTDASADTVFVGTTTNTHSSKFVTNGTLSETVSGVQFVVASSYDIGTGPNEIPVNGMLGEMAFSNFPFFRGGSDTTTTSGTLVIDGSSYERFNYTASLATGVTVQFSNMTNGREVKLYIRNTNATARAVNFEASTTTSGFAAVNLASADPPGGPSASGITLSGTTGTAMVWVGNINGTIVGGLY